MTIDYDLVRVLNEYPARLDTKKSAHLLGFAQHDIAVLTATGLLKPLGNPSPNAPKWFPLAEILAAAEDRDWLNKATRAVSRHWQCKNNAKRHKMADERPTTG